MPSVRPLTERRIARSIVRENLHAFEAVYAPGAVLPLHEHAHPFFTYVLRGTYRENTRGATRDCCRGHVLLHPRPEAHGNVVGPMGTASLNVEIHRDVWSELATVTSTGDLASHAFGGDIEWTAFAVWREFHRADHASALAFEEAVASLFGAWRECVVRDRDVCARRLDTASEFIAAHLTPAPGLVEVSRLVGVHPMHLAKMFRRRFGCSMGEFVRRRRIAWACEQLTLSDLTISAIAMRAGFADHAHFTRTFRRITGCSPRWYREQIRGEGSSTRR
jgi:AraC family transcriptional regulator